MAFRNNLTLLGASSRRLLRWLVALALMFGAPASSGVASSVMASSVMADAKLQEPLTDVWRLPVDPTSAQGLVLINPYRQPNSDYSAGHRGVDYLVGDSQLIFAPADGIVWFRGKVVNRHLISLKHGSSLLTELEPVCSDLSAGDEVSIGDLIGEVCLDSASPNETVNGSAGYGSAGYGSAGKGHCGQQLCLHFSLRQNGAYLSPLALIGGLSPSRLLPILQPG